MSGLTRGEADALAEEAIQLRPGIDLIVGRKYVIDGNPKVGNVPTLFINAIPTREFYLHIDPIPGDHDGCIFIDTREQFMEWKHRIAVNKVYLGDMGDLLNG